MNILDELKESKPELTVYCKNKMVYKHVNITNIMPIGKGHILELTNSNIGISLYGERKSIINSDSIERITILTNDGEEVL